MVVERERASGRWSRRLSGITCSICQRALHLSNYALQVTVYDASNPSGLDVLNAAGAAAGKNLALTDVSLSPGRGRADKTVDREKLGLQAVAGSSRLADGLELRAFALGRDQVRTGETLSVSLEWHSTAADLPDYRPVLRLVRDGLTLAEEEQAPAYGRYPTSWWRQDQTVVDYRDLLIPSGHRRRRGRDPDRRPG